MQRISPCSACGLPFGDDWVEPSSARDAEARTYLCPRCTMGRTISAEAPPSLADQYAGRLEPEHRSCALDELGDGTFATPTPQWLASVQARRIADLGRGLERLSTAGDKPSMLQVGSLDGRFLARASEKYGIDVAGIEPARMAGEDAEAIGIPTFFDTLETADATLDPTLRFDVIVEHHVLEHLDDPRAHLRTLNRRLAPGGIVIIEVPNLFHAQDRLESCFLQTSHPNVFTPRALATMCRRAGLDPFHVANEGDLRIFCRKGTSDTTREVLDGPDARTVAAAAWANDLRIGLKRGLARRGCTLDMLEVAERIHRQCRWQAGRADIAIEIAVALEREGRLDESASWLRTSLDDRKDGEIACMLVRIETILRQATVTPAPAATMMSAPPDLVIPRVETDSLRLN